jgi:uncharacterized protein (UPF0548 family)
MIFVRKPTPETIRAYVAEQSGLCFTYPDVGRTATTPPPGWVIDHTRVELGAGGADFDRARVALQNWKQFDLGWVKALPADTPIRPDETVAVLIRAFGIYWLNAARIVYAIDETKKHITRFGFAYGTLPGHVEAGEERFLVEWDCTTDRVFYDIFAFSRPRHILTRIAPWQVRRMQKRFARDSVAAMVRAFREDAAPAEPHADKDS